MTDGRTASRADDAPSPDAEAWQAVGRAITDRMAARRVGQQELADLAGISVSTLRVVQHGADRRVRNKTLAAVSRALDWPEDHLHRVLTGTRAEAPAADGGQPRTVSVEILDGVREIRDELRRIARRLDDMDCTRRPTPR